MKILQGQEDKEPRETAKELKRMCPQLLQNFSTKTIQERLSENLNFRHRTYEESKF